METIPKRDLLHLTNDTFTKSILADNGNFNL